jgi:hypothetical protein
MNQNQNPVKAMKNASTKSTATHIQTKNPVMVEAGKKAARTKKINVLELRYAQATSPGVKASIRREINKIKKG